MPRSHGIVLHRLNYNDRSDIMCVYTRDHGAVSFLVRRATRGRGGKQTAALGALTLIDIEWEEHGAASLQRPQEMTLWQSWTTLPYHPHKAAMSLLLAEFLYRALRSEQANTALFDYMCNALQWLDMAERDFANFHVVFLTHLTRYLGFQPNLEDWHEGTYFDLRTACFVEIPPMHHDYLQPGEASQLPLLLRVDVRSMSRLQWNGQFRNRALRLLAYYYRLHLPEFPEVRSIDILTEVFS